MPLLKRKIFEKSSEIELFKDNEEVFYCTTTKEMFRTFDEYFQRIMLINSMVWTCELTGRPNLTYTEALDSEKNARSQLKKFPKVLKGPVILVAAQTRRSIFTQLNEDVFNFIKDRYFIGEEVCVSKQGKFSENNLYKIIEIINAENIEQLKPLDIKYKVKSLNSLNVNQNNVDKDTTMVITKDQLRRSVEGKVTRDLIKLFLKQNIEQSNGMLRIKTDVYKTVITDENIKWSDLFIGKLPDFEFTKKTVIRKLKTEKNDKTDKTRTSSGLDKKTPSKQTSISKYLTKTNDKKDINIETNVNLEERLKLMKEKNESEKQRKLAKEREKQKLEAQKIQETVRKFNQINQEDLELRDQRPLPIPKPITTLVPNKYFGDFAMILEFMHTFSDLLSIKDKFPGGVSMDLLERALLLREIAGPLSDIFQVLLSTIFSLHLEEEQECEIKYVNTQGELPKTNKEPELTIWHATLAARFSLKYYGMKISDLPMDATTVSELLRIHLLSSGARVNDRASRWRFQQRGGYINTDDPGLILRMRYPHILRALGLYTVYQLPTNDIINIIKCLISQIMTFSTFRDVIEERLESTAKAKFNLRMLIAKEKKRKYEVICKRKELIEENKKQIDIFEGSEIDKEKFREIQNVELTNKLATIEKVSANGAISHEKELNKIKQQYFAYQIYLGTDRAHRNYWLFESIPGLFIEHDTTYSGKCLNYIVENIPGLAQCPIDHRFKYIRQMIKTNQFDNNIDNNKENNKVNNLILTKTNNNNAIVINNISTPTLPLQPPQTTTDALTNNLKLYTQKELMMCTADEKNCFVHSDELYIPERPTWSYFHTKDQIDLLINSLNHFGIREKPLRDHLENEKELIIDHISNCPIEKLNVLTKHKKELLDLMIQNMKKYEQSMMNYPIETDINEIMEKTLREYILELDDKITSGYLGAVKVSDKSKWRQAFEECRYDMQTNNLTYGFNKKLVKDKLNENISTDTIEKTDFEDPGYHLGNTLEIESEDSQNEDVLLFNSPQRKEIIHHFACALLQIKQGIELKYLKFPFAVNPKIKGSDNGLIEKNLFNWESSLLASTNFSQIFLHYNVLYDSIKWSQSADRAYCRLCRRKNDPDKMLLCDGCNRGHHMYCLKPKLTKIPKGDWFCDKCTPKEAASNTKKKRKIFSVDSDEEEVEENGEEEEAENNEDDVNEEDDEEDEDGDDFENSRDSYISDDASDSDKDICSVCKFNGELIYCSACTFMCHFECAKPALLVQPKQNWMCWKCKEKKNKRKRDQNQKTNVDNERNKKIKKNHSYIEDDEEEADDENPRRSSRTKRLSDSLNLRRSSRKMNETDDDDEKLPRKMRSSRHNDEIEIKSKRTSRRSYDDNNLPLHNVILYSLLEEIGKNEDSWPFSRPVQKHEVPDYYDIIKVPMDFAKIKSRLNLGYYKSDYDIMNDIQQVFANCDLYNSSESSIYQSGIRLEKFLENRCKKLNLPFRPSDMIANDDNSDISKKKKTKK